MPLKMEPDHAQACRRCGTCCNKGGPALHLEDQVLVETGKIALKDLFTIREGEPAYDNVVGTIQPADTDIIKIGGRSPGESACRFYDAVQQGCRIYPNRPLECRVLQCWDPQGLADIYRQGRLTRKHLLSNIEGLWDVVTDHQARCAYDRIGALADDLRSDHDRKDAQQRLMEIIRYDQGLREAIAEQTGYPPGMLDFIFGYPLADTIRKFRIRLVRTDQGIFVQPFI